MGLDTASQEHLLKSLPDISDLWGQYAASKKYSFIHSAVVHWDPTVQAAKSACGRWIQRRQMRILNQEWTALESLGASCIVCISARGAHLKGWMPRSAHRSWRLFIREVTFELSHKGSNTWARRRLAILSKGDFRVNDAIWLEHNSYGAIRSGRGRWECKG